MFLRLAPASDVFDRVRYPMNAGIAIAARMPMIATTIISSMRVKPSFRFSSFRMTFSLQCVGGGCPTHLR